MYTRFAFTLLFSFSAIGFGFAIPAPPVDERCGPNAHFLSCGSACAPTCANPNPGPACTRQCVIGCFCNEGYLKNAQGKCVRQLECDGQTLPKIPMQIPAVALPTCPDNEEFQACGSACAPTCDNPNPSPVCTKNCVVGCFCKDGHLRNGEGVCVPANDCNAPKTSLLFAFPPQDKCQENEIFLACGSACAPTCANPNPGPICTLQCLTGCFCKPGYLKNSQGKCVAALQCDAQVCGQNEEFRQCKGCDGTCAKPNPICPRICIPGCACKEGHLRTGPNGLCIPKEQCPAVRPMAMMMLPPTKCPANEVFHTCGTACPATCANPNPSPVCTKNCVIGCFCQEGYLRNEIGVCVTAANCQAKPILPFQPLILNTESKKCPSDREMYVDDCGTQLDCAHACHAPPAFLVHGAPQIPKKCLERKCAPSCVCNFPYVRNEQGQCVEKKDCDPVPFTTPSH